MLVSQGEGLLGLIHFFVVPQQGPSEQLKRSVHNIISNHSKFFGRGGKNPFFVEFKSISEAQKASLAEA